MSGSAGRRRPGLSALLLGVAGVAWARVVEACSVCVSATDGTREAYYGTTALMMLVPFAALAVIAFWLRRAAGRQSDVPSLRETRADE